MGEVRVPAHALWKAQTQRAVENFPISGTPIERALIGALAAIKGAAASVNADLGVLDRDVGVEHPEVGVDARGCALDRRERGDERPLDGRARDREVLDGALGLRPPLGPGRDPHLPHGVVLDAVLRAGALRRVGSRGRVGWGHGCRSRWGEWGGCAPGRP